jgi:SAM-dependent methyltransferase
MPDGGPLRRTARIVGGVPIAGPAAVAAVRWTLRGPRRAWLKRRQERARNKGRFRVDPPPRPVTSTVEPPLVPEPDRIVRGTVDEVPIGGRFDLELFEQLNVEYADRPLVPDPLQYSHDALAERSLRRMEAIHNVIDLADKRVLEFGCGHGYEVWNLSNVFGSDAWGVDVVERAPWAHLADERTHYVLADLAVENPLEPASFDRIVSINVFEHVRRPLATLDELYRVLRPGGLAWISANLYRGPLASHRYREVYFPWPHLLFDDAVFLEFYARQGRPGLSADWVNRLTWEQYEAHIRRLGFTIHRLRFRETPIDQAFYDRFEAILGRYPLVDLRRDFFEIILERPRPVSRWRRRLPGGNRAPGL